MFMRRILQSGLVLFLLLGTGGGLYVYHQHNSAENRLREEQDQKIADANQQRDQALKDLEEQRQRTEQLKHVVARLESVRRVAEIMVEPSSSPGSLQTTLLFMEYGKDGRTPLPPKRFVIDGKRAHIDAMVIKFDGKYVEENDPLRGHSVALFTRLFDETTSPEHAYPIDEPGEIPAIYRDSDPKSSAFEQQLWQDFWKLYADPSYRQSMGVRVAQGEGVWGNFEPGWLYTLNLESNGGLSLTNEPLKPILLQAFHDRSAIPAQTRP